MIEKVEVTMKYIKAFIRSESSGGIMLLLAAILGVITAATPPIAEQYFSLMHIYLGPMDVLEWVNDGLMALFFLYVGIEIKTEMISGELNTNSKRLLPVLAAFAGVVTPALVYFFNCWICTRIYAWLGEYLLLPILPLHWCHYDAW